MLSKFLVRRLRRLIDESHGGCICRIPEGKNHSGTR